MTDRTAPPVIGWDIGGAHVKACLLRQGRVVDVAQWACPLWQGLDRLSPVLDAARQRWPELSAADHAVTMTGEMVDLFPHREMGVQRIAEALSNALQDGPDRPPGTVRFYAGDAGWCRPDEVRAHWEAIASANWLATARHCAQHFRHGQGEGLLVDIGSTTTDLIAFKAGQVATACRTDAQRLASGELVYHGVVRTPLCALARRIDWQDVPHNVMNEFFATTADVYRLTGELAPAHDQHPAADGASKDLPSSRQRLARMIGLDARDASPEDWRAFAGAWRSAQVGELAGQVRRVMAQHGLGPDATIVSAGCGDFLVHDVMAVAIDGPARPGIVAYGTQVAPVAADAFGGRDAVQRWAQVCAPSVAVAAQRHEGQR
ncbi:hydantoinase/oxoprolinase family protein [Ideonella sp. A 288]|uniref:hydantoinase/oxoprolinase family protein n=1 Tax=Ideonella sp. A 288 TaxID=1962181 RepID=UPI000B4AAD88|nr:hydantoinase/oxoprolinase family protein [Ideonella sp. A 288]